MVVLALASALAAEVVCDPVAARTLLTEARIDEARVAETHPWLVPGLALSSPDAAPELRAALEELCSGEGLLVRPGPTWHAPTWSAHSLRLSHTEVRGCTLHEQSMMLSVGRAESQPVQYSLQARLPWSRTPIGDCAVPATWRDETILAGQDGPVRIVLAVDREGDAVHRSEVRVRRATPDGWLDEALQSPAPARLLGGFSGPVWSVAPWGDDWIVVESGARSGTAEACVAEPGQRVWTWTAARWQEHDNSASRTLLAEAGLWRLTGEDGWLLVLAQDETARAHTLAARRRRLERYLDWDLRTLESTRFPGLHPGFLVVTPPPFSTREAAVSAQESLRRRYRSYIKRGWQAPDPCATRRDGEASPDRD